ncbi:acetylornithine/succinylornithine family transaminase [Helicovermis profundi]|uniref:Acetylornithine transaminase n=1 Tax=Helicovermis profundi TaxID=3065157 RepID=A0AAU9EEF1_9FIRM|nr:acetylornithine transaminase [Clostridia bacterium S502]
MTKEKIYEKNSKIMKTYKRKNVCFVKGDGAYLYDEFDNKYLDFVSGVAVNILGHSNPLILDSIKEHSNKVIHISNLYWNKEQIKLAEKLTSLSNMESVFFSNSGTEAVETALKIAKKFGKLNNKENIIYMKNSFHGRTLGALSVTGQNRYRVPFDELLSGVIEIELNNIKMLEDIFNDKISAVIIEPIQGEGGLNLVDKNYILKTKELCLKYNSLLIFDEVQCGVSRTGNFFAFEKNKVYPDVLCLAKGLGGGLPIGATLVNKKADILDYGDHGSTFGGNPFICGVSNNIIDQVSKKTFLKNVKKISEDLKEIILQIALKYNLSVKVKGQGLLMGFIIENVLNNDIVEIAFKNKLLLIGAGNNVVRILPPLNLNKEALDEFKIILDNIFFQISKSNE